MRSPLNDDPLAPKQSQGGQQSPQQPAWARQAPAPQPTQAPTFSDLQRSGRARPAPPALTQPTMPPLQHTTPPPMTTLPSAPAMPGTIGQGPVGGQLQQSVLQYLQNPSRYGSDQAMSTFNRLNTQLQEGFDTKRRRTNENLASRGLYDSTIAYGDLQDLDTQEGRAQVDLAQRIAESQAQTESSDIQRAIQTALGYGNTLYGQEMGNRQQQWQEGVTDTQMNLQQQQYLTQLLMSLMGGT